MATLRRYRLHREVSPQQPVVGRGTRVDDQDGPIGTVDHVLVDEGTALMSHLVVDKGFFSQSVIVPVSIVGEAGEDRIFLDSSRESLDFQILVPGLLGLRRGVSGRRWGIRPQTCGCGQGNGRVDCAKLEGLSCGVYYPLGDVSRTQEVGLWESNLESSSSLCC